MTTQEQIIERAKELGFKEQYTYYFKNLPFGINTDVFLTKGKGDKLILCIDNPSGHLPMREVESLEDFEILYNAILPEKYRLPFD
jgi:hypothetical protein